MRSFQLFGVALALLLNGCASTPELLSGCYQDEDDGGNAEVIAVKEAVRAYIRTERPEDAFVLDHYVWVLDKGDVWGVTFQPPSGECVTGGVPEFSVNKKTMLVRYERWAM